MRIRLVLVVGVLAVAAATAIFPGAAFAGVPSSIVANLDSDRRWERLNVVGEPGLGRRVFLLDRCYGERVSYRLTQRWDSIVELRVRELDGATKRPEVWIAASSGTTGGPQLFKVVRSAGGCARPRKIFSFRTDRASAPPPYSVVEGYVEPADYRPAVDGLELRVLELLWEPGDGPPAGYQHSRRLYYEYVPSFGRYSLYYTGPIEGPPG